VWARRCASFPAAVQPAAAPKPGAGVNIEPGSGTILVVDDDPIVRTAVGKTLRGLGYLTLEAGNGADAVAMLREHRAAIRAVILDMIMPGMNGAATFAAMREIDPDVVVLLMSGYAVNEDVQALLDAGARGFVTKPYSPDTLSRALAGAITTGES
jgi:CheY-like chemotaxis protein